MRRQGLGHRCGVLSWIWQQTMIILHLLKELVCSTHSKKDHSWFSVSMCVSICFIGTMVRCWVGCYGPWSHHKVFKMTSIFYFFSFKRIVQQKSPSCYSKNIYLFFFILQKKKNVKSYLCFSPYNFNEWEWGFSSIKKDKNIMKVAYMTCAPSISFQKPFNRYVWETKRCYSLLLFSWTF